MISVIYELIGRLVVAAVRQQYARQIRITAIAGAALTAVGAVAYVATRDSDSED